MSARVLVLGLLALVSCTDERPAPATTSGAGVAQPGDTSSRVWFLTPTGELPVQVEVARSQADHARGLMFRRELARDHGMLFIFEDEQDRSFWMKNTYLPLDMIFVGNDLQVVGVVAGAEPLTETSRSVGKPSRYVVEVNAGYAREHGIGPGTRLRLELTR